MQTSIEWLENKLDIILPLDFEWKKIEKVLEQAKEMHKKELVSVSNQLKISNKDKDGLYEDDLPTTTTDLIDDAICSLPFDEKMKCWELIEKLIKEETKPLYTEEQVREAIELARKVHVVSDFPVQIAFDIKRDEIIQSLKQPKKD